MRCLPLIMLIAFASCSKKTEPAVDTTLLLTSTKWNFSNLLLEYPLGTTPTDITYPTFKPCETDDISTFLPNGTYTCEEGLTTCPNGNFSTLYEMSGAGWSLINNDSTLLLRKGFAEHYFVFEKKTSTEIRLYRKQKNYFDEEIKYHYIFQAMK